MFEFPWGVDFDGGAILGRGVDFCVLTVFLTWLKLVTTTSAVNHATCRIKQINQLSGNFCFGLIMADQAAKDAAAKQRIITHMNTDHQDSLMRYLEHFGHVPSFFVRNAKLEDMTLDSMVVSNSNGKPYELPILPPMKSWSEARPRLVAMDAEAVAGLHRSDITVKKFRGPKGFMGVVFVAAAVTFVVFSKRSNFEVGSVIYDNVMRHVPNFNKFCHTIQPVVLYPMIALHSWEAYHMDQTRLEKHSIPRFSKLWWKWIFTTFIGGIGLFKSFDSIVEKQEAKKVNAKH